MLIKIRSILLCGCLLCSFGLFAQQNTGSVAGHVVDSSGGTVAYAGIQVLNTTIGTTANDSGYFFLDNIMEGEHQLAIISEGYQTQIKTVAVISGQVTQLGNVNLTQGDNEQGNLIVTVTRVERDVEDVPLAVTVISGEEIQEMGSIRLKDVLEEQTGLVIVSDHGNGVQLQGFNSDYTMILINGQPLVGRTAGTMDLDRITVNNIVRIEITKGPSSSLYGNEALAGVINIITEDPKKPLVITLGAKYRTYNTRDFSAGGEIRREKLGVNIHFNSYHSDGYDLAPESVARTAPEFKSYTLSGNAIYDISEKSTLKLNGRFYTSTQYNRAEVEENSIFYTLNSQGDEYDWNIVPTFIHEFNPNTQLTISNYTTGYSTRSLDRYELDGHTYSEGFFDQLFNKSEAMSNFQIDEKNTITSGVGYILETLKSDRYNGLNSFNTIYGFVQHEWVPVKNKFTALYGARFDIHSEYSSQLSPKLAVQYKLNKWVKLKASAGTGFKAPDFRQLFLNFTNPTVGYSVFGASTVLASMQELEDQGQIQSVLIDYETIETINAERSVAYNFGVNLQPHNKVKIKVNLFRNDIKDLIESAPIAIKTNGQQVFSYFNINRVYTQGLESELSLKLIKGLNISAGYQYLEAKDKDVIEKLERGEVFAADPQTGQTIRVSPTSYGGLLNRSKHSGTFKLFYTNDSLKLSGSLRAIYRGRFGFGDLNNNSILDSDLEYVKGYTNWRLSVSRKFLEDDRLTLQLGVDNLFGVRRDFVPTMPGQFYYAGATLYLTKKST